MAGQIIVKCPAMATIRVSRNRRQTSEIIADVAVMVPGEKLWHYGAVTFPVCNISKVAGPLWQVEEVTALGSVENWSLALTLAPEWTFGPLALPCKAWGRIGQWKISMRFPYCWASWTGPKKWTVEAVTAYGTIS